MKIFVFGSSISSSYWNGAATYYRGIYKNLAALGHHICFAEPDIYERQKHRDIVDLGYVDVIVYQTPNDIARLLALTTGYDLVIKHSGVGAQDEFLERSVLECATSGTLTAFWDVDAPATLSRVEKNKKDSFRRLIPEYDFIFTYGGGPTVVDHYLRLNAANCHPIYNGLDPETHFPISPDDDFRCDLLLIANRLPDREHRIDQLFIHAAELAPEKSFILGGEGWNGKPLPPNIRWIGHVCTADHNRLNSSAKFVLNVNRESMAEVGYSPPTRVFEAAGSAACMITDSWPGIPDFFSPGREILVADSAEHIVMYLRETTAQFAKQIGSRMRQRALRDHTYKLRADTVDAILTGSNKYLSSVGTGRV